VDSSVQCVSKSLLALLAVLWCICTEGPQQGYSEELPLPEASTDSVVGTLQYTYAHADDTLLDIARRYDIGHDQIIHANPGVNRWLPDRKARILLPRLYLLPPGPREGIVLNLAELRLYYYRPKSSTVLTFPVSIGDMDWRTPLGTTHIVSKERNPAWNPPRSIRAEHLADGEILPPFIPGGDPENPLGSFALRLGIRSYLIHGTDESRAFGIGMRVSHGCIRLYPEDIEQLFQSTAVGTKVRIIDEPLKVGWLGSDLYLEAHRPLEPEEQPMHREPSWDELLSRLLKTMRTDDVVNSRLVDITLALGDGIPTVIGEHASSEGLIRGSDARRATLTPPWPR
jgi:L,D-transpeptidase ErfK/SrfK